LPEMDIVWVSQLQSLDCTGLSGLLNR
jgi:hypothetical protein